jgi:hypothetical protein
LLDVGSNISSVTATNTYSLACNFRDGYSDWIKKRY